MKSNRSRSPKFLAAAFSIALAFSQLPAIALANSDSEPQGESKDSVSIENPLGNNEDESLKDPDGSGDDANKEDPEIKDKDENQDASGDLENDGTSDDGNASSVTPGKNPNYSEKPSAGSLLGQLDSDEVYETLKDALSNVTFGNLAGIDMDEMLVSPLADGDIASGTLGDCRWAISAAGELTIEPGIGDYFADTTGNWPWDAYRSDIKSVRVSGKISARNSWLSNMFYGYSNLTSINLTGLTTNLAVQWNNMFALCPNLVSLNLSGLQTTSAQRMNNMFDGCSKLREVTLGSGFSFKGNVDSDSVMTQLPEGNWMGTNNTIYTAADIAANRNNTADTYKNVGLVSEVSVSNIAKPTFDEVASPVTASLAATSSSNPVNNTLLATTTSNSSWQGTFDKDNKFIGGNTYTLPITFTLGNYAVRGDNFKVTADGFSVSSPAVVGRAAGPAGQSISATISYTVPVDPNQPTPPPAPGQVTPTTPGPADDLGTTPATSDETPAAEQSDDSRGMLAATGDAVKGIVFFLAIAVTLAFAITAISRRRYAYYVVPTMHAKHAHGMFRGRRR